MDWCVFVRVSVYTGNVCQLLCMLVVSMRANVCMYWIRVYWIYSASMGKVYKEVCYRKIISTQFQSICKALLTSGIVLKQLYRGIETE